MEIYKNKTGKSSIQGYEIGEGFIKVFFKKGNHYHYDLKTHSLEIINKIKELAMEGKGLNSFINNLKNK